ncbi:5'-3' exonuclease [Angustibacter aerolatus]
MSEPADVEPQRMLLAVDGNSLLHRAYHGGFGTDWRDVEGRANWALRGVLRIIGAAADRLAPDALVVGFDHPEHSHRRVEYPAYKAGRPDKPAELVAQLADAPEVMSAAGIGVVVPDGWEADDVLASGAALAGRSGWRCTVLTSDRDSFALIDDTTCVLRLLDGGVEGSPLLTPGRLQLLCGVRAGQYTDFAALRGDSSDNLPGAVGIGPKAAAKLLAVFDGVDDALAALDGGRAAEVEAAIGVAATRRLGDPTSRENVARNQRLMTMRRDLPMPALGDLHLPLDAHRLQSALAERALALGRALWPLTGQVPMEVAAQAEAEREAVDLPPRSRAWTPTPTPAPAKAPAPEPADEQLSLFG